MEKPIITAHPCNKKPTLNNMKKIISVALMLVAFTNCNQHDVDTKSQDAAIDTAAIKASIDSLGGVVQKAHDTGDEKLMGSTWAKDGILIIGSNPPIKGREAIVSTLSKLPPPPPGGKMEIHPIEIEVLSSNAAYVLGVDSLKYTPSGASAPVTETSNFFVLVRKTPEGWQTYREILIPYQGPKK